MIDGHRPPDGRRGPTAAALVLAAVVGAVVLALILLAAGAFHRTATVTTPSAPAATRTATGLNAAGLYAAAAPGVVDITAHSTTTTQAGPFGLPRKAQSTDTGTGSVLDRQGRILTADHVVAGADSVTVTFQDGVTRTAKVLGGDTATDVAVLKVDPSGLTLHPLPLGSVSSIRIGDPLAVIGDPFNYHRSLSTGVVSGLDRTIRAPNGFTISHAVQTDAAMNPGNSGGPVLDAGGRVIGVADQIATGGSGADSSTGVGFAVPIDIAGSELAQLEAGAAPAHAFLGVSADDASVSGSGAGARVATVVPGSPAARGGIKAGDVIVGLGSAKVGGVNDLVAVTSARKPGDQVNVTVHRAGKTLTLSVTLAKEPASATNTG
ncbi:MAG TPA: trypsin-like peptidase domain-containing protein [Solirubrobacteraceae bacterium]|nr:trypsin-like peptidase domain-containing protein [Solirubrobacteraceae bacterium]